LYLHAISRLAKNAMSLLNRFNFGDQIPTAYYLYYGRIAWRFEHLQLCTSFLRRGVESGLSSGNPADGLNCAIHVIKGIFYCGENLLSVLKEIDYFLNLLGSYNHAEARNYMLNFRETVSTLIDRGSATDIEAKASSPLLVHNAIRMYWLGYTERCNHFIEKSLKMIGLSGQYYSYYMKFYLGKDDKDTMRMFFLCVVCSKLIIFVSLSPYCPR
jgi:hypothetical protein